MWPLLATAVVVGAFAFERYDRFEWLEESAGPRTMAWVERHNVRSLATLKSDPRYAELYTRAKASTAANRIPYPGFRAGAVFNTWQDRFNTRGLLRRTSVDSYREPAPNWETVLNFDVLAKEERRNWVYRGATCLPPAEQKCLLSLSDGGRDAVEMREFDLANKSFVTDGFRLPADKQSVAWLDVDTLLVARSWGEGTLTASGHPFVVKRWKRGTPLEAAVEVFRGTPVDVLAGAFVLWDAAEGGAQSVFFSRRLSAFQNEFHLLRDGQLHRLPLPAKTKIHGLIAGQLIFTVEEEFAWHGHRYRLGSLLSFDLVGLRGKGGAAPALIYAPGSLESIEQVALTRPRVVAVVYKNMVARLVSFARRDNGWAHAALSLPSAGSIDIASTRSQDDQVFATVYGYGDPEALYLGDAATGIFAKVKGVPSANSEIAVDRHEARARDGVAIPYFVMHQKGMVPDGSNPTLLFAYGGFGLSLKPAYAATLRRMWVERGGVYVVANIRGGGEFGPAWHDAGLKTRRQVVFDDFVAVAEDLIARSITNPRRLGIEGGSNGGLLVGVAMTQRPDLWNAVVLQVPLLDMLRFHKLLVGAAWIGEYGNPDDPVEGAFLRRISPYHNLRPGVKYPEPFFVTSTADDRVHPAHARKMAARMEAMGLPFYYYENADGGHATATNQEERAHRLALEFTYVTRKLMDCDSRRERCDAPLHVATLGESGTQGAERR